MPMRNQPDGVRRTRRGTDTPPREYDIIVDGERADGFMERLRNPAGAWRAYYKGDWRKFERPGAFLQGAEWIAGLHRAAKATTELVTVAEGAAVQVLAPAVADPFRGDPFADPLAP
jgi:hypothetical protein